MEDEYGGGRIPRSINVPLQSMRLMEERVPDKDTPLFVYPEGQGVAVADALTVLADGEE